MMISSLLLWGQPVYSQGGGKNVAPGDDAASYRKNFENNWERWKKLSPEERQRLRRSRKWKKLSSEEREMFREERESSTPKEQHRSLENRRWGEAKGAANEKKHQYGEQHWKKLTSEERRAKSIEKFRKLSPDAQMKIVGNWKKFSNLPTTEKQLLLKRYKKWQSLSPKEKGKLRARYKKFLQDDS